MDYITIIDNERRNVGTINCDNIEENFKNAIESHFDGSLEKYEFMRRDTHKLDACINNKPIEVIVYMSDGIGMEYVVELSQTWLYNN